MLPVLWKFIMPWGGDLTLYYYGFTLLVATVTAYFIFININKDRYDINYLTNVFIQLILIFYGGSYLSYRILNSFFAVILTSPPHGFYFISGGIMACSWVVFLWRSERSDLPRVMDTLVWALLPGIILVNLGDFLGGGCFGSPTSLFVGIILPQNTLGLPLRGAVHPVQLYAFVNSLQIMILLFLSKNFIKQKGVLFVLFVCFWAVFLFINEFFRGDVTRAFLGFSFNQLVLLVLFVSVPMVFLLYYFKNGGFYFFKKTSPKKSSAGKKKVRLKKNNTPVRDILFFRISNLKQLFILTKFIIIIIICLPLLTLKGQYWNDFQLVPDKAWAIKKYIDKIFINIPAAKLFYKGREYMISPGKPSTQTPLGNGYISSKRNSIRFVYTMGWRKGEVIKYGHNLKGEVIKIPYDKMRGLGLNIKNYSDYVIHATTEDWNIGKAASSGCVRMRIPDMLELFKNVRVKTQVVIDYILSELSGTRLIVYKDVYNLNACFVEGERIDFFEYTHDMVMRKTGKAVSYIKLKNYIAKEKYINNKIIIPLRYIVER